MSNEQFPALDGLFTELTHEELLRLWPLAAHAGHLQSQVRFVDYAQAELDAALLAERLHACLSPETLATIAFRPIPRGGLIVLGLLAYQLDLRHEQLDQKYAAAAHALVIVDDCALSGATLARALKETKHSEIVVAHLYSSPGLRSAILAADRRVVCCVAAHDLQELSAINPNAEGEQKMRAYMGKRFAPNPVEAVAFAWSEPDTLVLTPNASQPDGFWRFLPPHRSLNNRQALGLPAREPTPRRWLVPDDLVYGRVDDALYLLHTSKLEPYKLQGFAADLWRALAGYGTINAAVSFLTEQYPGYDEENLAAFAAAGAVRFAAMNLLREASGSS